MRSTILRRGPEFVAGTFALSAMLLAVVFESGRLGRGVFSFFYTLILTFPLSVITVAVANLIESINPSMIFNGIAPKVMLFLPGLLEALLLWWCLRRSRRPRSAKGWGEALGWLGESFALFTSLAVCGTGALIIASPIPARLLGGMLIALGVLQAFFVLFHLRNRAMAHG